MLCNPLVSKSKVFTGGGPSDGGKPEESHLTVQRCYFETGFRPYFLMPVFYFLFKFKVYSKSFGIAKRNVK